jgi:RNA polymerase sigma factor (sigma-70 family)
MDSRTSPSSRSRRPYVVAMMLGTALSALGSGTMARADSLEVDSRAIADLGRYCTTCWRNARLPVDSWGDCTQEVFSRLLERVPRERWQTLLQREDEDRREFLRAIDAVKKRTQRARKLSSTVDSVADRHDPENQRLREDREAVSQAAANLLSPRQQRILQLSFEGWSVQDMAQELSLPVERISDEKYKAIRKLRAHLGTESEADRPASELSA